MKLTVVTFKMNYHKSNGANIKIECFIKIHLRGVCEIFNAGMKKVLLNALAKNGA